MFFAGTGAVLEVLGVVLGAVGAPLDEALLAAWRARVERAGAHLGWMNPLCVVRRHSSGASLAMTAPYDQLFLATEVNEWALCAALLERDPERWDGLQATLVAAARTAADNAANPAANRAADIEPVIEESAAFARFLRLSRLEANPRLGALLDAAASRELPHALDETELTLGAGSGGRSFPLGSLPVIAELPWPLLHDIPTALVTGSNGKTTTVRLIAACARAHGWRAAYNCTDGVFIDESALATGDYSGPAGARMVLREQRAQAAVLETARGGILRRGIAVSQADTAVVTNVSADHFGEYGIDDLAGLADVKLSVAAVVKPSGLLVLNADDPQLRARVGGLARRFRRCPALGWFALDADHATLNEYRMAGAWTCGVRQGRIILTHGGGEHEYRATAHDLGPVAAMPLSMGGVATYNVANLLGAALAAAALGIPAASIAAVFARFGADANDNPGRMMRFEVGGVHVLIDYAHNPAGLCGFLTVAQNLRGSAGGGGRLGLLLGQAGNRKDADIEALVRVAAEFRPDLVVVKENEAQLRGRAPGEVPRLIHAALLRQGLPESALTVRDSEFEAVLCALDWAQPGDVLAMPVHSSSARAAVVALLKNR